MEVLRNISNSYTEDISFVYISLDTIEGASCVGHWIWECALFLPSIKQWQKEQIRPIKILLNEKKQYKINILADFGFTETDIEYSSKMTQDGDNWTQQYVIPDSTTYTLYAPTFFYLWTVNVTTTHFFTLLDLFRNYYINLLQQPIQKTIPITYIARSKKENYTLNFRNFENKDEFETMLVSNNINILYVDELNSFASQFDIISRSKNIIVEMGSAFTINAVLIASNSNIIIINDTWNYSSSDTPFFQIYRKLISEHNNTINIFSHGNHRTPFIVDIPAFNKMINTFKITRSICTICNHNEFELINTFLSFPSMAISTTTVVETLFDYTLMSCKKCNCLQLESLVDPDILYSDYYMNAIFSSTWTDHNTVFSDFILANTADSSFLEIGANSGKLYDMLSQKRKIEYSVLDMFKHKDLSTHIIFKQGNCETYDFTGITTIILSHVFEHLYEPRKFIENIKKANVSTVFISIPDFDKLLKGESLQIINSQHTYSIGIKYMLYMFSLYKYRCDAHYNLSKGVASNMFKFVLDLEYVEQPIPSTDIALYKQIYIDKIHSISAIEPPPTSYIMPSGIYGQYFYYFLKKKDNIIGFLDNNSQRHNKKLYGTNKLVYSPMTIDSNATIIVCDCPYKEEIIAQLQTIHPTVTLLYC